MPEHPPRQNKTVKKKRSKGNIKENADSTRQRTSFSVPTHSLLERYRVIYI